MENLFEIGYVVVSSGVAEIADLPQLRGYLAKHQRGDWGTLRCGDKERNDHAVKHGGRIFSAYPIDPTKSCDGKAVLIITQPDRTVTTILMSDEY